MVTVCTAGASISYCIPVLLRHYGVWEIIEHAESNLTVHASNTASSSAFQIFAFAVFPLYFLPVLFQHKATRVLKSDSDCHLSL